MVSKILGILADLIALVFMWIKDETIPLWLKIVLSLGCIALAVLIFFVENWHFEEKVIDYLCDAGTVKHVFIRKNSNFMENSLVSVYYHQHGNKQLSAIGYVVGDSDGSLQVIILQTFGSSISCINQTKKSHKDFTVTPTMKYCETESLFRTSTV